ncbi:hypothetical protein; putative transposase fragment [Streptococcus mutans UA159]|uniref:Uncharacterized protein n=1 Tax=Streptococcus mutans serotype c (strain ATCC 700610 / UA159) TaxID=210007 RepID=Q8DWG3_STRMU|nr:hypothetical protein; putative transposase fragment [Streptococcus mutans UA159]
MVLVMKQLKAMFSCYYRRYASTELAQRRNINHCKISNSSILVLLALQVELDSKFQY